MYFRFIHQSTHRRFFNQYKPWNVGLYSKVLSYWQSIDGSNESLLLFFPAWSFSHDVLAPYLWSYPGGIALSQPFLPDNVKASASAHLIRQGELVGKGKLSLCTSTLSRSNLSLLATTEIVRPRYKPVHNVYPTNVSIILMHVLYSHHNYVLIV